MADSGLTGVYDLALTTVRHDDELLVHIVGRLDAHTDGLLVGCCRSWVYDGVRGVVLDLSDLGRMDGHGFAALLRCRRVVRAHAGGGGRDDDADRYVRRVTAGDAVTPHCRA